MGRLSRHRKIKSCDPFFTGHKEIDLTYNAPVNASEIDNQPFPRKAKNLLKFSGKVKKKVKKVAEQDGKKSKVKLSLVRREGETQKDYFDRLEKQTAEEVVQIMSKGKHVRQKRKEFLKARKEKSRKKRMNIDEEKLLDFTADNIKFGEVVHEPPNLTKPHKRVAESKLKVDSLLLQRKLTKYKNGSEKDTTNTSLLKTKKHKHMSAVERQVSDKRRLEAIDAYRKLKKKRIVQK